MFWRAALAVAAKDLRTEIRGKELLPALVQFVVLSLLIANFAFDLGSAPPAAVGPGVLWLVVTFVGLLAFGRAFAAEKEQGTLEAMLMTPAGPVAVFFGKALAAALTLIAVEVVLLPGVAIFIGAPMNLEVMMTMLVATFGISALGSLVSALAAETTARELLLPALALPVWLPFVVVGGYAVQRAMAGPDPGWQPTVNLIVLDIMFVVVCALAARFVLDD